MPYFAFALICALSFWVCIVVNLLLLGDPGIGGALIATIVTYAVGTTILALTIPREDKE